MREKVEDMAGLAAALREAAAENETWRGSLLSVANAISKPIPADARAVVREALEAFIAEKSDYMERNRLGNPERSHTIKQGRAALTALDAAPAEGETLPEWARVDQRGALWITSPSTYDLRVAASDRTPDEMERMATALSRRVARLRREPE